MLEEMTTLDTTAQGRISILVYADMEAAFDYLVRVFALGPGELTRDDAARRARRAAGRRRRCVAA